VHIIFVGAFDGYKLGWCKLGHLGLENELTQNFGDACTQGEKLASTKANNT